MTPSKHFLYWLRASVFCWSPHCKFNIMVVKIWEMNCKGRFWGNWRKTDLQIFTELILRMGWVYQLKSYWLRKLFSGCKAPWLYCLKKIGSLAVGLIAKFLWLYCQIFLAILPVGKIARKFWLYSPELYSHLYSYFVDRNIAMPSYPAWLYYHIFLAT